MFNLIDADETLKLDNQLCFALYALSRKMTSLYRPLLKELNITYPQYLVLMVLWEEAAEKPAGVAIKHLCERLFLDTGTLTPLLKRLETNGFVSRQRSVNDEREVLIALTSEGVALKEKAAAIPMQMLCSGHIPFDKVGPLQQELRQLLMQMGQGESA